MKITETKIRNFRNLDGMNLKLNPKMNFFSWGKWIWENKLFRTA
ncbi:hypothetical protein [Methanobrevibacter arboriphilus]|nr:hypothetical protein [Methanobrevibacter arboriphilus]